MTETQKRIKAYKAALPGLKERVIAVALLLAMSLAMMTSASFAWLTISRRPEVTGVNTTIAANGNLEIALMDKTGSRPQDSKVGDSSANSEQSVANANLTWGNLINLADPSYGLENLTMRPAQLNKQQLLTSPLWGAEYSGDGRIIKLNSDFKYSVWNGNYFEVPLTEEAYGVRAISSAVYDLDQSSVSEEALEIEKGQKAVEGNNRAAANAYSALGQNAAYMQSLATMMGLYMTARMNPDEASLNNPDVDIADIQNLRDMYKGFIDCFVLEAKAIAELVNFSLAMQHYDQYKEGTYEPDKVYSEIDILGFLIEVAEDETITKIPAEKVTTTKELSDKNVQVGNNSHTGSGIGNNLEQFQKDYQIIVGSYEKLATLCQSGTSFKWQDSGINTIVNSLVDVGKCTIGKDNTPISSIGASNAMGYLSGTQEARITNGILYRFEERTGGYIEVKNLGISAKVKRLGITIPATVKANIQTSADRGYTIFGEDYAVVEGIVAGLDLGDLVYMAEDTYGLAVDLWVRTNAEGSYLTLEGNVLTEEGDPVPVMGKDPNGNAVELYTVNITSTDEEGNSVTLPMDLYKGMHPETGEEAWYDATNHSLVTEEDLGNAQPVQKVETPIYITGYEGENRVWTENELLSSDSTTQGSGSCYVYYADTPEDQARSLKLLESFNVAFVNEEGGLMATAVMDTEHFYAASGRVIVPLVLSTSDSINLGENFEGEETYAITALEKNVPTRVTAIVYLDGTKLTNKDVLSAADIHGQLNIQFGSSQSLKAITNEELESKERRVTATVDEGETSFDYDTHQGDMISHVTVHVSGDEPSSVTAFFLRSINASQGSREETMTFTKNEDGDWVSSYTFTVPGNYVLRTVRLDGVDYDLAEPPTVTVNGFTVKSLSCDEATNNHINILSAANSSTVNLNLQFAANDPNKMPKKVQGRFLNDEDGSAVNVDFTFNPTSQIWSGSATFLTSGDYTMQYLVLDGEYTELESRFWQTADLTLGMRVSVYTTSPHRIKYVPSDMAENEKMLAMQVKIFDNAGGELQNLGDAKLTYGLKGSSTKFMDTDLKWDGTDYVGELQNGGPGVWQFRDVTVGSNVLSVATTSPTFTIMSPEPPKYVDHTTAAYQYAPNNDAVMKVRLTNSSTATMQACIVKTGSTQETWVDGTNTGNDGNTQVWSFTVPKDANGYQDGNWQMTQLKVWDVFDTDGTEYTEANPLVFDVSDKNIVTKVVCHVIPVFAAGQSKDFGKDADGNVTATFMQSHTISGLNVDFKDFAGENVSGVSDVQLTFEYVPQSSKDYGGYESADLSNGTEGATVKVNLTDPDGDGKYTQAADAQLLYAGEYTTTFSYKVNGVEAKYSGDKLPANAPVFTVSSNAPTVKVTAVSPTGTFSVNSHASAATGGGFTEMTGVSNSFSDYYACVFIRYTGATFGTWRNYAEPSVTLQLSGMPDNFTSASMTFGHPTPDYARTFTFEPGNKLSQTGEIGHADAASLTDANPPLYFAGEQTVNTIDVVYNGITFKVNLSHEVTINQPQFPRKATFAISDSSFTGTLPSPVYSTDGETIVVTLPTVAPWSTSTSTTSNGEFVQQGDPTTRNVYTQGTETTGSGCDAVETTYYTPYIETTTIYTASSTTTTVVTTRQVTGWTVGGKTYAPGETITLTGDQTITAVVTTTSETTSVPSVTTRTVIAYTQNGDESTNKPSGNQVYSTAGSTTDKVN